MSFENLNIKSSYKSDEGKSILTKFYLPVLKESKTYKRAVGYFNSKLLIHLIKGIQGLINNGGEMKLIVSPELEEEDIISIEEGYDIKGIIQNKIIKELDNQEFSLDDLDNLEILKELIIKGILEIKVAFMKKSGVFHNKIGIFEDVNGSKIAFTGSLNETYAAIFNNYESIDVFRSWIPIEFERIKEKELDFDLLWNNEESQVSVIDFPKAIIEKSINKVKKNITLIKENNNEYTVNKESPMIKDNDFALRDYQLDAILGWKRNNYRGIYSMATGTGKTFTAIGSILALWEKNEKENLFVIIVCPYVHLVEQWVDDLIKFNINPIIAYGEYKWERDLRNEVRFINRGIKKFSSVIVTNSTYTTDRFQKVMKRIDKPRLILVDEMHNFGAERIRKLYDELIEYRLGLSATPTRYFDDDGTKALEKYFDKTVYELSLEDAIKNKHLTEYYYHPKIVYLSDDEYEEYKELSLKIAKIYFIDKNKKNEDSSLTSLLIKRSRILNLAINKIETFKNLIKDKTDHYNNLVYCAAGTIPSGERQIEAISKLLGNELKMDIQKFTAEENMETRKKIINDFENNNTQCIVAIKCLDEGVNIPSIESAYILASSGNEKEFIQRRGRVLRKFPGKNFARIYDFIVLPREVKDVPFIDDNVKKVDSAIIKKELRRMKEFTALSINQHDGEKIITEIEKAYNLIY